VSFLRSIALASALVIPTAGHAELEHRVKAAFVYQFLSYVEWPEGTFRDARAPFVIGVLDADDIHDALQEIVRGRSAQGRSIEVRKLAAGGAIDGFHVIVVGEAGRAALNRLPPTPGVLVVGEGDRALERGAMVSLVRSRDHVRFQVALGTAERHGLKISSRMLAIAEPR
jgi:hypothetical protein